jgi:hypothetical protein
MNATHIPLFNSKNQTRFFLYYISVKKINIEKVLKF